MEVSAGTALTSSWFLVKPVRRAYSNFPDTDSTCRLGIDSLHYTVDELEQTYGFSFIPGITPMIPELGTFYVGIDLPHSLSDSITACEPLHRLYPEQIVQFAVRSDDTYPGFLTELINTPFIMAPRSTPAGFHQADDRLGCDCAAFAVYGKRRQGFDYRYLGPWGILEYLEPVFDELFHPVATEGHFVYRSADGLPAEIGEGKLQPGCILHFGEQVSVFLSDEGVEGLLDSDDLLFQSWFDGPHICRVGENGFPGNPVRIYRWMDEGQRPDCPVTRMEE